MNTPIVLCAMLVGSLAVSGLAVPQVSVSLEKQLSEIAWVGYSPTGADPQKRVEPTQDSIAADLAILRKARFTGLVTYGSNGVLGRELPRLASAAGFKGLILGIWNPESPEEVEAAIADAKNPIVLGICVGNEGLGERYSMTTLSAVVQSVRKRSGKPVTTTEIVEKYADKALLDLGEWVFPNAHPYFHSKLAPDQAVKWTADTYHALREQSGRFVMFKEVGLPTAGSPGELLSEVNQDRYYVQLRNATDVHFVYFEAFDQLWKTHLPVEPHWGVFESDRKPKLLACHLMGNKACPPSDQPARAQTSEPVVPEDKAFYVYLDYGMRSTNHFTPSGYMGDTGDINIDEGWSTDPHSGKTSIRITYNPQGRGPSKCDYAPPCKWGGVYWQEPPDNWGDNPEFRVKGFDLSSYRVLKFWARADSGANIEFKVGGIKGRYGDSLKYARSTKVDLTSAWKEFQIDLGGADLRHIIGAFAFSVARSEYPQGITFYLDDIRFK